MQIINLSNILPPTVAPTRATASSSGMLKKEFSASHVSAKAFKGVVNIKALPRRSSIAGNLNSVSPCGHDNSDMREARKNIYKGKVIQ